MSETTIHQILGNYYLLQVNRGGSASAAAQANLIDELRFYLETDVNVPLTDERSAMLYFERQFNSSHAFASTMGARELLLSLPGFMDHMQDQSEQRRQAALVLACGLKQYLTARRLVDAHDHLVRFTVENFMHLVTKATDATPSGAGVQATNRLKS